MTLSEIVKFGWKLAKNVAKTTHNVLAVNNITKIAIKILQCSEL